MAAATLWYVPHANYPKGHAMDTNEVVQEEEAPKTASVPPPYISFKTLTNLIERMEQKPPPPRIDRSYLIGMSGGYQSQVLAALRWLDLVGDDGELRPTLIKLVQEPYSRTQTIAGLLEDRYGPVVALGKTNATQGQLEEAFRAYGLSGSTVRKAIAFYLHAADYAGLPVSPHFRIPPARGSNVAAKPKRKSSTSQTPPANGSVLPDAPEAGLTQLRARYIDMLLKRADQDQADESLLDRIERLLGFDDSDREEEVEPVEE
jgi:hypothetical protein